MKIENVLKDKKKSPETTGEKKNGKCHVILQNIITLYAPIGNENGPETCEKKDGEEKVAHLMQEKRHAMKRASARERHEVLIKELEWKVEQLSGQVQSLQEQNHGLRKYAASLDTKLKNANDIIDVLSSRAVYILRRFHQMYRSKLEQHRPVEDNVPIEDMEVEGNLSYSRSTCCSVADVF